MNEKSIKIVNAKELVIWSPSLNWAMLDAISLGFINKWRFLRFLKKHGYRGNLFIVNAFIYLSPYEKELRPVVSAISPDEVSKSFVTLKDFVTLKEIGKFDGETIYFLEQLECRDLPEG